MGWLTQGRSPLNAIRRVGRAALSLSAIVLSLGMLILLGSALVAGGWWEVREPLASDAMAITIAGLVMMEVTGTFEVVVEPVGRLRLLAVPPIAVVVFVWWAIAVAGAGPVTGTPPAPGQPYVPPTYDLITILHNRQDYLVLLTLATVAIPAPLIGLLPQRMVAVSGR